MRWDNTFPGAASALSAHLLDPSGGKEGQAFRVEGTVRAEAETELPGEGFQRTAL